MKYGLVPYFTERLAAMCLKLPLYLYYCCCDYDGSAFIQRKELNIRPQISVMVFIQELSLARTRTRSWDAFQLVILSIPSLYANLSKRKIIQVKKNTVKDKQKDFPKGQGKGLIKRTQPVG